MMIERIWNGPPGAVPGIGRVTPGTPVLVTPGQASALDKQGLLVRQKPEREDPPPATSKPRGKAP